MDSWEQWKQPVYDSLQWIPENEQKIAASGEEAATLFANHKWYINNDAHSLTILSEAVVDGFEYQIDFFCRPESMIPLTVFLNKKDGQYVTVAWCNEPPEGWEDEVWPSMKRKQQNN